MLSNYLKLAIRVLLRRKFFTFISLFGIAVTLVVLIAVVAVFDCMYGPRAPETRSDRSLTIQFAQLSGENNVISGNVGWTLVDRAARDLPGAERTSIFESTSTVSGFQNGARIDSSLKRTDAEYWRILDYAFVEGAPFSDDDVASANPVAVINEATRNEYFAGEPAVGKTINVDGQNLRVVGVVENVPLYRQVAFADVWTPLRPPVGRVDDLVGGYGALVLARSADDIPEIQREYARRVAETPIVDTENFDRLDSTADTALEFAAHELAGSESTPSTLLGFLTIAALMFMLLPAVNLVNLNISRVSERAAEIGVRKAFGASSWTIVGQFVVENIVLTLAGGAVAFVLSYAVLAGLNSSGLIPYADFRPNLRVFAYGLFFAVVFGVLSGVYPAWRMSRLNPIAALKGRA